MMKRPFGTAVEGTDPAGWVERHGNYLFGYALRRLRRPELAEDLVQEALLGALRNRDQFAGVSSERTWLVSILKRKIVDHLRRQHREQPASTIAGNSWMDELFDQSDHWRKGPAKWPNPSAAVENAEFWETFSRCLDRLPRPLAEAFILREVDELPSAEVCQVLEVSVNHLFVMMHRARLQLWRCLDVHWFAGERDAQ